MEADDLATLPPGYSAPEPRGSPSATAIGATIAAPGRRTGDRPGLSTGESLGRYVIIKRIGQGGMGVVYAAYDPELDRKVALKVLHPDPDEPTTTSSGTSRLLREAQAMARLTDPNVVTVYDVGSLGDAVFVAMELIEGKTLTAWLAIAKRSWSELLPIFVAAGRGLDAAHRAGLVHRDFKPDNVMIGDDGRVRVLDFGLARPTGSALEVPATTEPVEGTGQFAARGSLLTRTGALMGTPAYMSPEQCLGKPADARSDQFSFCVALYEALWRVRPFDGESIPELLTNVAHGNPREPTKGTAPPWLVKVVMRGLAGDPAGRHADMSTLLGELTRDRSRRIKRIAIGLGVLAIPVAAVVGAGAASSDSPCSGAAARLSGVWDDERRAAVASAFDASARDYARHAAGRVLPGLDTYAEGWVAMHEDACAATRIRGEQSEAVLDVRMACLDDRLQGLRGATDVLAVADDAALAQAIGVVDALPDLELCADLDALTHELPPADDPQTRAAARALHGEYRVARALTIVNRVDEARARAEQLVERARTLGFEPVLAEALMLEAVCDLRSGRHADALGRLDEVVELTERTGHDRLRWEALDALGYVEAVGLGRTEVGRRRIRQAEAVLHRVGNDPDSRARLLLHRAAIERFSGNDEDAIALVEESMAVRGENAPENGILVEQMSTLADLRLRTSFGKDTSDLPQRALELAERMYGADHPNVGLALVSLGRNLKARGDIEASIPPHRRAMEVFAANFGPDHPNVAVAVNELGLTASTLGRYEEALEHFSRALGIIERSNGPDHVSVAAALGNRADVLDELGRNDEALIAVERAKTIRCTALGPEHEECLATRIDVGGQLRAVGRAGEAEAELRAVVALLEAAPAEQRWRMTAPLRMLGLIEHARGNTDTAVATLERALSVARETADGHDFMIARCSFALAKVLWSRAPDRRRARELAEAAAGVQAAMPNEFYTSEKRELTAWLADHTI